MIRRPPRSTRTEHTLSLHDALPIYRHGALEPLSSPDIDRQVNLLVLEHPVSVVRVQTGIADTALDHFEVQFQLVPSGQDGLRPDAGERRIIADRPPDARAPVAYRGYLLRGPQGQLDSHSPGVTLPPAAPPSANSRAGWGPAAE